MKNIYFRLIENIPHLFFHSTHGQLMNSVSDFVLSVKINQKVVPIDTVPLKERSLNNTSDCIFPFFSEELFQLI